MSGRTRQQYGRSATTSYSSILQDSRGDILHRCSNLFNKFASRVRAASQSGDDRVPLHGTSNNLASSSSSSFGAGATTTTSTSSSSSSSSASASSRAGTYSHYPMLLKYNKYDDVPKNTYDSKSSYDSKSKASKFEPAASQYKPATTTTASSTFGSGISSSSSSGYGYGSSASSGYGSSASSGYGSGYGTGYGSSYRIGNNPLSTSASFSSFSTFKTDYDGSSTRSKYGGSGGGGAYSSSSRPSYSRTSSDLGCNDNYGLRSAYATPHSISGSNYDKIGSRYKPSRFLRQNNLATTGCDEEDESSDELCALRKNASAKKNDYWSQYGSLSPNVMERCLEGANSSINRLGNLSPQLRRRHGDGALVSGSARQRAARPTTVPEATEERESTASIMNRYSGLSTSTVDTETGSTTSSATPDSVNDDATRRKERAQLINMYSLPLNVLHSIGSSHNRKFLKRMKEPAGSHVGEQHDSDSSSSTISSSRTRRYDQVKEMAAKVTEFCSYIPEEDGCLGPPRKVLYGSASTSDVLSSIGKGSLRNADNISKHSTPDSEKFVLYDPPIVFEKAIVREKPPRLSSYGKPVKPTSLALTRTNTMDLLDSPSESVKSGLSFGGEPTKYMSTSSLVRTPNDPYGVRTPTGPTTPTIKISSYLEPEQEYTFTTFKPSNASSLRNANTYISKSNKELDKSLGYVPALTPKSPLDQQSLSVTVSVKPKTSTVTSSTTLSNINSKHKADQDSSYALLKFKSKIGEGLSSGSAKNAKGNATATAAATTTTASGVSSSASGSGITSSTNRKAAGVGGGVLDLLGIQEVGTKSTNVRPQYSSSSFYNSSSVSSEVSRAVLRGQHCSTFSAADAPAAAAAAAAITSSTHKPPKAFTNPPPHILTQPCSPHTCPGADLGNSLHQPPTSFDLLDHLLILSNLHNILH